MLSTLPLNCHLAVLRQFSPSFPGLIMLNMTKLFGWCGIEKFKHRCIELLRITPETFLCGFLWTGFSIASGCGTYSVLFYFSAGFGSGLGALVGHAFMNGNIDRGFPAISRQELFHSVAYFFAIFLGSGTTWQRIVNDTLDYDMNFTESFFYMLCLSSMMFLAVLTVMRMLNTQYTKAELNRTLQINNNFMTVQQRFYYDMQLATTIGMADAFFLGTVGDEYSDNWLGPAFAVHATTLPLEAMCKSGASTLAGFAIMQLLQNMILVDSWLDPVKEEVLISVDHTSDAANIKIFIKSPIQDSEGRSISIGRTISVGRSKSVGAGTGVAAQLAADVRADSTADMDSNDGCVDV